eukprot:s8202_g5.t1
MRARADLSAGSAADIFGCTFVVMMQPQTPPALQPPTMRQLYLAGLQPVDRLPGAPVTPPELFEQDPPDYVGGIVVLKLFCNFLRKDRLR